MPGPIKPSEVDKRAVILEPVFEVFNLLIAEKWDGQRAVIPQREAVERITAALGIERRVVFDRGLLDIESAYRKAGWRVAYDKPGFNETGEAFFTFSRAPGSDEGAKR
jgi:hypothetical protein